MLDYDDSLEAMFNTPETIDKDSIDDLMQSKEEVEKKTYREKMSTIVNKFVKKTAYKRDNNKAEEYEDFVVDI